MCEGGTKAGIAVVDAGVRAPYDASRGRFPWYGTKANIPCKGRMRAMFAAVERFLRVNMLIHRKEKENIAYFCLAYVAYLLIAIFGVEPLKARRPLGGQ
jgi:hypothetical protein